MKRDGVLIWLLVLLPFLCGCTGRDAEQPMETWGKVTDGLQMHIWMERQVYRRGEDIPVSSAFRNCSKSPLQLWQSSFWPNTKVEAWTADGQDAVLTAEGYLKRRRFSPGGERDKNFRRTIKPGHVYPIEAIKIDRLFVMAPDTAYFVQFTYEEKQSEGWIGSVKSNVIRVIVRRK